MNAPQTITATHPGPGAAGLSAQGAAHDELARRILVFGALLGWCIILVIFRMRQAASFTYAFLEWNLLLAVIPAVASWFFARAAARRAPLAALAFWFAIWLAFLPNAPYVITDLLHLGHARNVPIWYDLMMLGSCGATGLLLGYVSLADVQTAVAQRYSVHLGWTIVIGGMLLSGFAIYLGRFLRLNSWDTIVRPLEVISEIAGLLRDPGSSTQVIGVTLIYGGGLLLGYIALRALAASRARLGVA
jgi:uncharacterized membrane protein